MFHLTFKARFIANILSLSGTGNLNRLITVWWCIYTAHRTDRIECECWCFRKEPEPDVSRPQGSLTNINNNMSFSDRVLSSGRSRGADLLSILSDTFAYKNPSHKPAGIYEFITWRGESAGEPENNLSKNYEELVDTGAPNDGFLLNALKWNREKLRDIPICCRRITFITPRKPIPRTEHVTWVRWIMNFWSNQQEWKEKTFIAL